MFKERSPAWLTANPDALLAFQWWKQQHQMGRIGWVDSVRCARFPSHLQDLIIMAVHVKHRITSASGRAQNHDSIRNHHKVPYREHLFAYIHPFRIVPVLPGQNRSTGCVESSSSRSSVTNCHLLSRISTSAEQFLLLQCFRLTKSKQALTAGIQLLSGPVAS